MDFSQAIASGFRNYVNFSGRAARSEYWYWTLFVILVAVVTTILDTAIFPQNELGPINTVATVILFLPGLAVSVRRLHDIDRTGWWILLALTIIGIILLIVWACIKGTQGSNRFGPDPLAGAGASSRN
jgi:uncharacterized membrane protein YhaH (DUF805 family)